MIFIFVQKQKKINEKKEKSLIIENCIEFDFIKTITRKKLNYTSKKASNLKTKKLNNSKSKSKSKSRNKNEKIVNTPKIFKYQPKPKKKNKENEAKFSEYKKKLNNRLKNYKSFKYEDIMKKMQKEQKEREEKERLEKKINLKKNINKSVSIKKEPYRYNFIPKQRVQKFIVSKTEHRNNISRSKDKDRNTNSTISFNKTSANNNNYFKYSFYSLFDINSRYNNDYSGSEQKSEKSKKKIIKRFIENGQKSNKTNKNNIEKEENKEKYDNNNKYIVPRISDNINKQNEKSKTINTQSSRYLIKKINSSNFKNRNINNSLFKIKHKKSNTNDSTTDWLRTQKKNNINLYNYDNKDDLPGLIEHKNINHKNQCNHIRYDKHFGNENNCPKCQSMDIKINYLKEKKNEIIPKINSHQINNSFNKTLDDYKRDNIILPFKYFGKLYLKNYNNYKNNTKKLMTKLQRNNSVIQIKKINIMKYSEQLLKNYKSSLLAIKEYFNIK